MHVPSASKLNTAGLNGLCNIEFGLAIIRKVADKQVMEDDAEAPDVYLWAVSFVREHFWSSVMWRSAIFIVYLVRTCMRASTAEVHDPYVVNHTFFGETNILKLEVPMNYLVVVHVADSTDQVAHY